MDAIAFSRVGMMCKVVATFASFALLANSDQGELPVGVCMFVGFGAMTEFVLHVYSDGAVVL